jgi:hypothetical protein
MGKTPGRIYSEVKFFSTYDPTKPDKLYASQIQWWDIGYTFLFQQGEI